MYSLSNILGVPFFVLNLGRHTKSGYDHINRKKLGEVLNKSEVKTYFGVPAMREMWIQNDVAHYCLNATI